MRQRRTWRMLVAGLATLGLTGLIAPSLPADAAPTKESRDTPMGWSGRGVADTSSRPSARAAAPKITGVLGIDVASYQRGINWSAQRSQGRVFAYVKATEGTSYKNPYFTAQFSGSYGVGMFRGAYHFANPSGAGGAAQADYFVKNGGGWRAGTRTLPGVLDIEYSPYAKQDDCFNLKPAAMVSWIRAFTARYKQLTKRDAVIYTTTDWWTRCTGNSRAFSATNPLWIARHGTSSPGTLPGGWTYYTFWQYSSSPLDQNKFSAPVARLTALANNTR